MPRPSAKPVPPAVDAAAPAAAPVAAPPAPFAHAALLATWPLPQSGGSYIRQPDGTLTPAPSQE